jgi:chromosome segregation ATPase
MTKRPPDAQSKQAANSLRDLKRQMENGSARVMSAEKKLSKLIKSRGSSVSKNAEQITNAVEQTSTARERLLEELGDLASAIESGRERDFETGQKRAQQSQKVLADAVKRLDQSIKSGGRGSAPGGGTSDEAQPDIEKLAREVYEAVLRMLDFYRQRAGDPWL